MRLRRNGAAFMLLAAVISSLLSLCSGGASMIGSSSGTLSSQAGESGGNMLPVRIEKQGKRHMDDILRHIGMAKVKAPDGNHRKRLASRPRLGDSTAQPDSHIYVIKLPSNKYYYEKRPPVGSDRGLNRLAVDFKSNGKPGKIYHWNLPIVAASKMHHKKQANQVMKWPREEKMAETKDVTYYRPKKPGKQPFQKYFPSNGKPHSLYVIERSHYKAKH